MGLKQDVSAHRTAIDRIDSDILALLSKRAREVKKIGDIKRSTQAPIRVPEREHRLLSRLKRLNKGPYSDTAIEAIYREIISASLALEAPLQIAYLGPEGTFSHQAAVVAFGHSVDLVPQSGFQQIFEEVSKRNAAYGVVPVENSIDGMVYPALDLLMSHSLSICAEVYLPVRHCFLTHAHDLSHIKKIYSHPQVWGQCGVWLRSHAFDRQHFVEVASTAKAAELATKLPKTAAAIASRVAAETYRLPILEEDIQDSVSNETRFVVIGHDHPAPTGRDKTTVVFQVADRVGVLAAILGDLAKAAINITKIESRPSRAKDWEYVFYLDIEGHGEDPKVRKALAAVERHCTMFRPLGSYPCHQSLRYQAKRALR